MHAAAARYVSVSELYSTDEVELLLDEIRDLEPTSCRGEDIQDFEIAGSGLGAAAGSGARSPAGTERSWDSHAHYSRAPPLPPRPLAPVYCSLRLLLAPRPALQLLIVLCSVCCCACVWSGAGLQLWALPGAARVRLLLLAAVTSPALHGTLLLLRVTRLEALLPLRWARLGMAASLWSFLTFVSGSAGSIHALLGPEYRPAPYMLMALLYSAAGLGLGAACASGALVGLHVRACAAGLRAYRAVPAPPAGAGPGPDPDPPL